MKIFLRKPPGLSFTDLAKNLYKSFFDDNVLDQAAQLGYYFLLALFPLLILLVSIFGLVLGSKENLYIDLLFYLNSILPTSAFQLVASILNEVRDNSTGTTLSFSILLTLWAASSGISSLMNSLNQIYGVAETRPWWKLRLLAIALTITLSVLAFAVLFLVFSGTGLAEKLALKFGYEFFISSVWSILRWILIFLVILTFFAVVYYFSPNTKTKNWYLITPGAIVGIILWILASYAFRVYLSYFDTYNKTYGSIGAVITLMIWLYITGLAILFGGELNAEFEAALARAGDTEAKQRHEHQPSEAPKNAEQAEKENVAKQEAQRKTDAATDSISNSKADSAANSKTDAEKSA